MNCQLIFADGTILEGLTFHEETNTLISSIEVTEAMLTDAACETVQLIGSGGERIILRYAKHGKIYHEPDGWHFSLAGATPEEIKIREQEEQIQMLTECILEMSEIVYNGE
jgi:hypothetical protein